MVTFPCFSSIQLNNYQVIRCLLIVPFPESSLNEEAGKLFQENYQEYFKLAKLYTSIHSSNKRDLTENNNKLNIDTDNSSNDIEKNNVKNNKNFTFDFTFQNNENIIPFELKKHSKSHHIPDYTTKINNSIINEIKNEEKMNLNSFSIMRANLSANIKINENSKTKQDDIKKWLLRL